MEIGIAFHGVKNTVINFMRSDPAIRGGWQFGVGILISEIVVIRLSHYADAQFRMSGFTKSTLLADLGITLAAACAGLVSAFVAGKIFDRIMR